VTSTVCRLGITSVWPLVKGRISRIARYASSSQIRMAGASPATIAQNTQDMPPRYWPSGGVRRPVGDRAAGRPGYAAAVDASDIAFAGAAAQARMLADGELSAPELLEIYLDRIARLDSRLRCYRVVLTDSARHEAAVAQDRLDAGERLPLLGVPIAIKDDVDVAGEVTTYGSGGHRPAVTSDAEVIHRLRAAGAVVIGKTNVPEFGYSGVGHNPVFPATRNPWNLDMTSGGSSAGSGASVAAGVAPFAIGSDGGAAASLAPPSGASLTAISNPGFSGIFGANSALAVKLVTSRTRQVPRMAPRILLSSKESILDQAPGRNVDLGRGETAGDERQESGFRTAPERRSDIGLPVLWQPV